MPFFPNRREKALKKELQVVMRQEGKLRSAAIGRRPAAWRTTLEEKIPPKVYDSLEDAFCKGFSLVFKKGHLILERSYDKEDILKGHQIRDYTVRRKGRRKDLRQMHKSAKASSTLNLALTTVEGIGLGALGIGLPDIVLFITTLLRGIYETALNYGCDCEKPTGQYLILKIMATALSSGPDWETGNAEVDDLLEHGLYAVTEADFEVQLEQTSAVFALDMLLLKFIQGLPLVSILGGAANPVYYQKVLRYVQLKYRKRYLLTQLSRIQNRK